MRAVVAHGIGDYRFERVPRPHAGPGELVLRVEACGICAGDLKAFQGGERFWGGNEFEPYVEPPCIPGHEFVGIVDEVGPGYTGPFAKGDRVTAEQIVPCGECYYCRKGLYWMCDPHNVFGFKRYLNGGMAEYVKLPFNARVYRVPKAMPLEKAVLIEPYACSMHGVDRGRIEKDDVVVVSGAGTLGLGMIAYAHAYHPRAIVALDKKNERLAVAKKLGATHVFNPDETDVKEAIAELTDGVGCDVYIEVAGHPSSVLQGLQLIRKKGRFVEFSVFGSKTTTDWSLIGDAKELDIYGSSLSPYCFEKVIQGIESGDLGTEGVVTHAFSLEDFMEAFQVAGGQTDQEHRLDSSAEAAAGIKVILRP